MKRKAQSALEYMMTYGWAILIIVIVAAVLYSMGIFNPSSSTGTTATGFSPFTVLAQQCSVTHGLQIQLGNNAGNAVTITGAAVTTSTGMSPSTISASSLSVSVSNGASVIVNGTASAPSGAVKLGSINCTTAGSRYSATITVNYTETNGALGQQSLTATGTVAGTASS